MPRRSAIGKIASKKTKSAFAEELSSHTAFTAKETAELFPNKSDRDELVALIEIVNSDKNDKEKQAELVARIGEVGGAVLKLSKKVTTGL